MPSVDQQTMFVQSVPYPTMNEAAFVQQLKNQIEFYFRPQNLANDQYLLSHLHATEHIGAVPIQVLCYFPKVRQLYSLARFGQHVPVEMAPPADPSFLHFALKGSSVVTVSDDGMWVMPNVIPEPQFSASPAEEDLGKETSATVVTEATAPASPSSQTTGSSSVGVPTHPLPLKERNTVILRDIPSSATEETVLKALSSDLGIPKSARPDIGNTWYVTFESEEHAVSALAESRDRTIDGAPIRGHLKSELAMNKDQRPTPPSMHLPPAAAHDRAPAAPLHPPTHAPYYPMHPMLVQQSYAYGYVPYGYLNPSLPPHYGYPAQQRYAYGYLRPQKPANSNDYRSEGSSAPPSSVFVRPNQANVQNGNGKKKNKRYKARQNKNNQNGSGDQSADAVSGSSRQQQTGNDSAQNGIEKTAETQTTPSGNKKQSKHRGKRNSKKPQDQIDMSEEHFPALGGKGLSPPRVPQSQPNKPGYAAALLKHKSSSRPSRPESESGDAGLESAMNKLAFAEAGVASRGEW